MKKYHLNDTYTTLCSTYLSESTVGFFAGFGISRPSPATAQHVLRFESVTQCLLVKTGRRSPVVSRADTHKVTAA